MNNKVILAFLQNLWHKEPERVKEIYARYPSQRNDLIARFLFMGCLTGRRLMDALKPDLTSRIIWEETSREIGNYASSKFEPDLTHIENAIRKFQPDIILCFGKVAQDSISAVSKIIEFHEPMSSQFKIYNCIHPAARGNAVRDLKQLAERLKKELKDICPECKDTGVVDRDTGGYCNPATQLGYDGIECSTCNVEEEDA